MSIIFNFKNIIHLNRYPSVLLQYSCYPARYFHALLYNFDCSIYTIKIEYADIINGFKNINQELRMRRWNHVIVKKAD